jgi:hypothetical protein
MTFNRTCLNGFRDKLQVLADGNSLPRALFIVHVDTRLYTKVYGLVDNEIYAYNNEHLSRINTKRYDGKTH